MPNSKFKYDARGAATGAVLTTVAGLASFQAMTFDGESRFFPLAVAVALIFTGIAILVRALLKHQGAAAIKIKYRSVLLAVVIIAVWAAAFSGGLGFILPTFCMQALLLWVTGQRRFTHIALIAAGVTALAYGLFVILLDVPMPASMLPDVLQGY